MTPKWLRRRTAGTVGGDSQLGLRKLRGWCRPRVESLEDRVVPDGLRVLSHTPLEVRDACPLRLARAECMIPHPPTPRAGTGATVSPEGTCLPSFLYSTETPLSTSS